MPSCCDVCAFGESRTQEPPRQTEDCHRQYAEQAYLHRGAPRHYFFQEHIPPKAKPGHLFLRTDHAEEHVDRTSVFRVERLMFAANAKLGKRKLALSGVFRAQNRQSRCPGCCWLSYIRNELRVSEMHCSGRNQ